MVSLKVILSYFFLQTEIGLFANAVAGNGVIVVTWRVA